LDFASRNIVNINNTPVRWSCWTLYDEAGRRLLQQRRQAGAVLFTRRIVFGLATISRTPQQ
jgi:hypothetical protein